MFQEYNGKVSEPDQSSDLAGWRFNCPADMMLLGKGRKAIVGEPLL